VEGERLKSEVSRSSAQKIDLKSQPTTNQTSRKTTAETEEGQGTEGEGLTAKYAEHAKGDGDLTEANEGRRRGG